MRRKAFRYRCGVEKNIFSFFDPRTITFAITLWSASKNVDDVARLDVMFARPIPSRGCELRFRRMNGRVERLEEVGR